MEKKEIVTVNSAGYLYGKIGFSKPNISTHMVGLRITNAMVVIRPIIPP